MIKLTKLQKEIIKDAASNMNKPGRVWVHQPERTALQRVIKLGLIVEGVVYAPNGCDRLKYELTAKGWDAAEELGYMGKWDNRASVANEENEERLLQEACEKSAEAERSQQIDNLLYVAVRFSAMYPGLLFQTANNYSALMFMSKRGLIKEEMYPRPFGGEFKCWVLTTEGWKEANKRGHTERGAGSWGEYAEELTLEFEAKNEADDYEEQMKYAGWLK